MAASAQCRRFMKNLMNKIILRTQVFVCTKTIRLWLSHKCVTVTVHNRQSIKNICEPKPIHCSWPVTDENKQRRGSSEF